MTGLKILIYLFFASLAAVSCSRKSECKPEVLTFETSFVQCSHEHLVHHNGEEATYEDCGIVDHWRCSRCGMNFSDSLGKITYKAALYKLPLRIVDVNFVDIQRDATTKGWAEVPIYVGLTLAVSTLTASITGLIYSIESITSSTKSVMDKIRSLGDDIEGDNEKLDSLKAWTKQVEDSIVVLNTEIIQMRDSLRVVSSEIDNMLDVVDDIGSLEEDILQGIRNLKKNVAYSKIIDGRYQRISSLLMPSVNAWRAIHSYSEEFANSMSFSSEENVLEQFKKYPEFSDKILGVVSSWGNDNAGYAPLTVELLTEFFDCHFAMHSTFPEVLEEYYKDHFVWHHREQSMVNHFLLLDYFTLSLSKGLVELYYPYCSSLRKVYADNMVEKICEIHNSMTSYMSNACNSLEEEYADGPWLCTVTHKSFEKNIYVKNEGELKNSVENDMVLLLNNGELVGFREGKGLPEFYGFGERDAMSLMDLEMIEDDFIRSVGREANSLDELLFSANRNGMIFTNSVGNTPHGLVIPYSNEFYTNSGELYLKWYTDLDTVENLKIGFFSETDGEEENVVYARNKDEMLKVFTLKCKAY